MIQKNYHSAQQKKPPQKFIPRRDLFPDAELPPPSKAATTKNTPVRNSSNRNQADNPYGISQPKQMQQVGILPVHTGSSGTQGKKSQPLPLQQPLHPVKTSSLLSINPITLFLLLAGGVLLWPQLKAIKPKLASDVQSAFKNVLDNPQSIQMLRSIGPYLETKEQDAVYTVAGIIEAISTFHGVMNHTYQNKHQNMIMHVPSDPVAKNIEIMKVVKPYIPQSNRKMLSRVIGIYDTAEQLNRNIDIYRNNRSLAGDRKVNTMESIGEIVKVIRPALPKEHREKADKAIQMLKMADVIGTADKISRDVKKEKEASQKKTRDTDREKTAESFREKDGEATDKSAGKADALQNMMDSFLPMLNDEQKDSMGMIMKMAQLLTQPGDSAETDSDGH